MPIPEPQASETKEEFIAKCIREISKEYDTKQAAAICYQSWKTN